MTDDTEHPSEEGDDNDPDDATLAKVIPFSRTMTAKARKAVRSLGYGRK